MAAIKTITYKSDYAHSSVPHYWIELVVTQNSKNNEENSSNITFKLLGRSDSGWSLSFRDRLGYIEVDGERIVSANTNWGDGYGDGGGYNHTICSVTKNIAHNSDGSLSLPVKGYFDYSGIVINDKYTLHAVSVSDTFSCSATSPKPTISVSSTSSTTDTVKVNWQSDYKLKTIYYRYSSDGGTNYTSWGSKTVTSTTSGSISISGLSENTKYYIQIKGKSVGGVTSNTITTNKTTATSVVAGVLSKTSTSTSLESITVKWSCDKYINKLQYKVGDQSTTTISISKAKSGSLKISNLSPNTSYNIKLSGVDEDGLTTNTVSTSVTTKNYSKITTSSPELIFGEEKQEISLNTPDTSSTLNFEFYVDNKLIISQDTIDNADKVILSFDDDTLDAMYKLFGTKSTLDTKYKIITKASNDYVHEVSGKLKLTGNAKTMRIGINNSPRRAKVFVNVNGTIKHAVAWVKADGSIRRSM